MQCVARLASSTADTDPLRVWCAQAYRFVVSHLSPSCVAALLRVGAKRQRHAAGVAANVVIIGSGT